MDLVIIMINILTTEINVNIDFFFLLLKSGDSLSLILNPFFKLET